MNDSWHIVLKIHQYSLHMSIFHLHLISITRNCHLRPIRNIGGESIFHLESIASSKSNCFSKAQKLSLIVALAKTTEQKNMVHFNEIVLFWNHPAQSYTLFLALMTCKIIIILLFTLHIIRG